jgi:hypothetical protein
LLRIIRFPPERKGERLVHREARPRSDMDLLVLGIHGVFGEWLQMLPAARRGEPPDVGSFMHRNVATVAFAEHFPLHMGWSQLAALGDGFAIGADQPLRRRRAPRDRAPQ